MTPQFVHPYNLNAVWPRVRGGIEELLRICPEEFSPEDVFARLREEKANLYLLGDGFCVLEVSTEPFNGKRSLNVWLLHWKDAEENHDALRDWLKDARKQANCANVQFRSPRMGWMKKAKGFRMKLITWEMVE